MAASTSTSLVLCLIFIIMLIASMQLYKVNLASNELMTIVGGFLGSVLFVFILTAIGNLEKLLFGNGFQTKLVPEILFALFASMFASALIHRVSVSTCLIFSLISLFYINKISQAIYAAPAPVAVAPSKKKK